MSVGVEHCLFGGQKSKASNRSAPHTPKEVEQNSTPNFQIEYAHSLLVRLRPTNLSALRRSPFRYADQ